MKNFAFGLALATIVSPALVGCGDSGPTNMVENADKNALAEYERMVAEDSAAMSGAMKSEGAKAPAADADATK